MGSIVSSCITDVADRERFEFLESRGMKKVYDVLDAVRQDPVRSGRLNRIIHGDNIRSVGEEFFDDCFKAFCVSAPEWSLATASEFSSVCNIFWASQSEDWCKKVLIIREQSAGYCFLITVFTFEHYVMALRSGAPISTTYNVGKYEAATLRGEVLKKFILYGFLDTTLGVLKSLCRVEDSDLEVRSLHNKDSGPLAYKETCQFLLKEVATQPAIIGFFKASHMSNSPAQQVVFTDPPGNQPEFPRHAMLLVGARKGNDGEYYFLVENWWKSRYFLELSGQYIASCSPTIIFVKQSVKLERNEKFEDLLIDAVYAETCTDISDCCLEG